MSTAATLIASINFSDGPTFDDAPALVLGDPYGVLGTGVLGGVSGQSIIVDVTPNVMRANIRRQYSRTTDTWNPGYASVEIVDTNGDWNPDNTASPYYGLIKPMRKLTLQGEYGGTPYALFRGYIQSWRYTAPNGTQLGRMAITAYDGFLLFNNASITGVTGAAAGDLTGERITAILDQVQWPTSLRAIDPGNTTCQADPGTLRSTLSALQTIEETEFGAFYMDWDGRATFKDRDSLLNTTGEAPTVFTDDGTGVSYTGVEFGLDDTLIQNYASIQPEGMTAQVWSDAASISTYFTHSVAKTGLLMDSEADALNQAKAIVSARAYDTLRVDSLQLNITDASDPARVIAALDLDFLSNIRVVRTAPGAQIDKTLLIHGVSHDVTQSSWVTTFQTVEPVLTGFLLGNGYAGVLGSSALGFVY